MRAISFNKSLRVSLSLLLLLSVCQLNSYAIDPNAYFSGSTLPSEQVAPTSFEQTVLKQFNDKLSGFSFRNLILDMMLLRKNADDYSPKHFPVAVVRSTSICLSDVFPEKIHDEHEAIGLNNDGVKHLNAQEYPAAIKCFNDALKLNPEYGLARGNLAIAHNNYGLSLRKTPATALTQFQLAQYINPHNITTQQNTDGIIRMMGLDPKLIEDRMRLGDQAGSEGKFLGALVEYRAAFDLKPSSAITAKILDALSRLTNSEKLLNPYFIDKSELTTTNLKPAISGEKAILDLPKLNYDPYMSELQRAIERKWLPRGELKSSQVSVVFCVNERGELTGSELESRSGITSADQAAMQAVEKAAPFPLPPPLPPSLQGSSSSFKITFNYKFLNGPLDFYDFPVDFDTYMKLVTRKIKQQWEPPDRGKSTKTVLRFSLNKKGNLSDLKISSASGSRANDLSAERAVQNAVPFPASPPGADDPVDIEFTFDYYARHYSALSRVKAARTLSAALSASKGSESSPTPSPEQRSSKTPYPFSQVTNYTAVLGQRLEKNWSPQFNPITVIFRVGDGGEVSGLQVYSSSGDTKLDAKALSVVRSCAPFPKPPAGALPLDVQYTFK